MLIRIPNKGILSIFELYLTGSQSRVEPMMTLLIGQVSLSENLAISTGTYNHAIVRTSESVTLSCQLRFYKRLQLPAVYSYILNTFRALHRVHPHTSYFPGPDTGTT